MILFGRWKYLPETGHSRRHAVILNFPDDVWLYDLGSATGIVIDRQVVFGNAYLDGVRQVTFGSTATTVSAKRGLLL